MLTQILVNGLIAGSIYAIAATGFALVYATLRFFNLAYGVLLAAGAYVTYASVVLFGWPLPAGFLSAVVICVGIGLLIDQTAYRSLRRQRGGPLSLFLCSFGIFIVLQGALAFIFGNQTYSLRAVVNPRVVEFGGVYVTTAQLLTFFSAGVTSLFLYLLLLRTQLGTKIRAVADNPTLANYVGLNSEGVARATAAIGAGLAAIAGGLIAAQENLTPGMGFSVVLKVTVACIIGGAGSVSGAILGAFIVGLLENLIVWQLPAQYKDGVALILLTIFLLFKPTGLLRAGGQREDQLQHG